MKAIWLCAAMVLAVSAARAGEIDDLKAGKVQCYAPNLAKHTCAGFSRYTFSDTITNQAELLLAPQPLVTMKTSSVVTIRGDEICGKVSKSDIDGATISVDGAPAPQAQADAIRAQIWGAAFAQRDGKEICTIYTPAPDGGYTTTYTMDGQPDPSLPAATVILIDPKDGYTLGMPG